MTTKPVVAGALTALTLLLTAGPAAAHVTVQPNTATAGEYTVVDVRVPNERDDADTTSVSMQMPPGFASASYQPVPGWKVTVKKEKLAKPIETDDGQITEGVSTVTWSGGRIPPGAFQDFPLSVLMPDKAGTLTFKAIQKYAGGETVRWIGAPGSDEPAPTVTLSAATAATAGHGGHEMGKGEATSTAASTAAADETGTGSGAGHSEEAEDSGSDGLAIAALIVGAIGVLLGAGGLAAGRRKATA